MRYCLICSKKKNLSLNYFCTKCLKNIDKDKNTSNKVFYLNNLRIHYAYEYSKILKKIIFEIKTQPFQSIQSWQKQFIETASNNLAEKISTRNYSFISSIPGNPWRCLRQTDLSLLLAEKLSKKLSIKHEKKLFRQKSFFKMQKKRSRVERLSDFKGRIQTTRRLSKRNQKALIIDDILSTGSTLMSTQHALSSLEIECEALVLCRNPIRQKKD